MTRGEILAFAARLKKPPHYRGDFAGILKRYAEALPADPPAEKAEPDTLSISLGELQRAMLRQGKLYREILMDADLGLILTRPNGDSGRLKIEMANLDACRIFGGVLAGRALEDIIPDEQIEAHRGGVEARAAAEPGDPSDYLRTAHHRTAKRLDGTPVEIMLKVNGDRDADERMVFWAWIKEV